MKIETTQSLTSAQKDSITRLWNAEYPKQLGFDGVSGFDEFLNGLSGHRHFLIFDENKNIRAWLVSFTRDDERWFSIIVDSTEQKKGYGTRILDEVKRNESEINGWIVEHDDYLNGKGEKYFSPIEFYRKNGFSVLPEIQLEKADFYAIKIKWKNKFATENFQSKYAAFLRGVNVGGKNMIKMEVLREMFSSLGFSDVKSYINSGNIIFETNEKDDLALSAKLEQAITETFSLNIKVMTRKISEIETLVKNNPFAGQFENDKDLHVFFLDEDLSETNRELLLSKNCENEMYAVQNREIFCLLRIGVLDSLMGKGFIDKKLKVSATARNWRTVNKILEL